MRLEGSAGKPSPKPPVNLADLMFGQRDPAPAPPASLARRDFGAPLRATAPAAQEEWHPTEVTDVPRLLKSAAVGAYNWVAEGKARDHGKPRKKDTSKVWTPWGALTSHSSRGAQQWSNAVNPTQQGDLPYAMGTGPKRAEAPQPYGSGAYNAVNQMGFQEAVKEDKHAKERAVRQDVLGIDQKAEPTYGNRTVKKPAAPGVGKIEERGDAWYNALSDRERAAVDFNTMLVDAVKKDLANQKAYNPTDNQRDSYDAYVTQMFGKDRGSKLYAPETMSLLLKLGRQDADGEWNGLQDTDADLDDFLGLNAAITADDISNLDLNVPERTGLMASVVRDQGFESGTLPSQQYRLELSRQLADKTAMLQDSLAKGNAMLDTIYATSLVSRNDVLKEVGGLVNTPKVMLGYRESQHNPDGTVKNLNTFYRDAFDLFADKKTKQEDRDAALAQISSPLTQDEWQGFWEYADQRSANALRFGTQLTDTKLADGSKMHQRSPQEFRELLGLDEVRR